MAIKILSFSIFVVLIFSCKSENSSKWTDIYLRQSGPTVVRKPSHDSTTRHGEMQFFEANLLDTSNNVVGQVLGYSVLIDPASIDGMGFQDFDERMTSIVYRFNETDAILVQGGIAYNPKDTLWVPGRQNIRPIVGGTGIYRGIRGQSILTYQKKGQVDIKLEMIKD